MPGEPASEQHPGFGPSARATLPWTLLALGLGAYFTVSQSTRRSRR